MAGLILMDLPANRSAGGTEKIIVAAAVTTGYAGPMILLLQTKNAHKITFTGQLGK